jgi:hypothetical protein
VYNLAIVWNGNSLRRFQSSLDIGQGDALGVAANRGNAAAIGAADVLASDANKGVP